jgi:dihydroorotate dehydrogenase
LWFLEDIVHRVLKLLPPEEAHRAGLALLGLRAVRIGETPRRLRIRTVIGEVSPPVGLAAGFDKTGRHVSSLAALGFGFVVAGSATLHARKGNMKPRIVRKGPDGLVNAMGLPNPGVKIFADNLRREVARAGIPVVASIAGSEVRELVECYEALRGVVAGVEVNLSSPSLSGATCLWSPEFIRELVAELSAVRWSPIILKVPPLARAELRTQILRAIEIWAAGGMDAVTAVNTLPVEEPRLSTGFGGLSGRQLKPHMLETVREASKILEGRCEVFAVGGLFTAEDVAEAFEAGARAVQIYTALALRGPSVVRNIQNGLIKLLDNRGAEYIEELFPG